MDKGREGSDGSTMEFRELLGRSVQVGVDSHVSKKAAGVAKETLPRITAEELAGSMREADWQGLTEEAMKDSVKNRTAMASRWAMTSQKREDSDSVPLYGDPEPHRSQS